MEWHDNGDPAMRGQRHERMADGGLYQAHTHCAVCSEWKTVSSFRPDLAFSGPVAEPRACSCDGDAQS